MAEPWVTSPESPDAQLWLRWQQGQPPDVAEFLAGFPALESAELVAVLLVDQCERWQRGERVSAEDYLRRFPVVETDPEAVVELAYGEFLLREQRGEAPTLDEYLGRFPTHAERLRQQVDLYRALQGGSDSSARRTTADQSPAEATSVVEIPGYEVREELGRGGMGCVLRAFDPDLERPLAVKVLLADHQANPHLERRFLEEARVTGQLQHPAIPPVHEVGRLGDGRPFFAMKLIQGRTLAELLNERKGPAEELPHWLAVFAAVCQGVGYAHSRGVIHRDLKPSNVMVGAFAEVQVMDWGLAKVLGEAAELARRASEGPPFPLQGEAPELARRASKGPPSPLLARRANGEGARTQPGDVMGTLAFMAPEQARGEVDAVDARSDVFGLGAILCVILTGQPPYRGSGHHLVQRQAMRADLSDAFARLDGCGADPELLALARSCLAPRKEDRPADGGEVARLLAAYQAGVEQRLRRAELERTAAQVKAAEERKRRRLRVALAAAVLLLVAGLGVAGLWYRAALERDVAASLSEAEALREQAAGLSGDPRQWELTLRAAGQALEKADVLVRAAGVAGAGLREQVEQGRAELQADESDRTLAERFDAVRIEQSQVDVAHSRFRTAEAYPKLKEALQVWGVEIAVTPPAEAAYRIAWRPEPVRSRLIEALDLCLEHAPQAGQRRWLAEVLGQADPDPWRGRVRRARADRALAALIELVRQPQADRQRPAFLVALSDSLPPAQAIALLSTCRQRHPDDFWANHRLADHLSAKMPFKGSPPEPQRLIEAARYYTAALALRPGNPGVLVNLGIALKDSGDTEGAIRAYREAVALAPAFTVAYTNLGSALRDRGDLDGAIKACRKAIAIDREFWGAYYNLGRALRDRGDLEGAISAYREAAKHQPDSALVHRTLAAALYDRKDFDGAVRAYRRAAQLEPHSAEAYSNLAGALHARHDLEGAVQACRKAIQLDANHAMAHCNLGVALRGKGDLRGAVEAYRKAVQLDPRLVTARYNLGLALSAGGDVNGAVEAYRQVVELDPGNARAHCDLAQALYARKDREGAIKAYRRAIALDRTLANAHYNLGIALYAGKDLEGAIEAHRQAIALDPNDAMAHVGLGNALHGKGNLKGAVEAYRKAVAIRPDYALAYNNLGSALRAAGDVEGAVKACKRAVQLVPRYALAHINLGDALAARGDLEEAVKAYHTAGILAPGRAEAPYQLGLRLRDRGDLKGAVRVYRKLVDLAPRAARAYHQLGLVLRAAGDLKGAVEAYRRAVALDPKDAPAHYSLGNALYAQKDLTGAIGAFRQAVALNPGHVLAHNNLGLALYDRRDLKGAVAEYRRAIALEPGNALAHNNLGNALEAGNDREGAVRAFRKAIELDPKHAQAHYNLGRMLHAGGDLEGAVRAYAKAIELAPEHAESHCNQGQALQALGRFTQALASLRRGHELGRKLPGWPYPSANWVEQCRRLVDLDARLPGVLAGTDPPRDAAERLEVARLCARNRQLNAAAARFYAAAFEARPAAAADLDLGHRYNAACAAALAASGKGKDAADLDAAARVRLRKQALGWLTADLAAWLRIMEQQSPQARATARRTLADWLRDADLAGVRDRVALVRLPPAERAEWRKLWDSVTEKSDGAGP